MSDINRNIRPPYVAQHGHDRSRTPWAKYLDAALPGSCVYHFRIARTAANIPESRR